MYQYLCLCMNMHVFTCTSCHAFIPNQIFPFPCFSVLLRQWETWLSFSQHICSFVQCRAPRVLPFFPLLSSTLLCFLRHHTRTTAYCMRHPLPTLPSAAGAASHSQIPLPLPTPSLRRYCSLSRLERSRKVGNEGRKITYLPFHWWMGLRLSQMFTTTHAFVFNKDKSFCSIH